MKKFGSAILCVAIATFAFSCKKSESTVATTTTAATGSAPAQMPPGHPPVNESMAAAAGKTAGELVSGKVLESKNSAGFTYVKLQTKDGEQWAALPQADIKPGSDLVIVKSMTTENFESKSLNRTFDKLIFGTIPGAAAMPAGHGGGNPGEAPDPHENMPGMGNTSAAATSGSSAPVNVPKAAGGSTVAEIWGAKASLKDKPVVVRGKVVKYNSGILGKNWLHLRDGSGTDVKGDNDITVTTSQTANVGDVVVVTGTLRLDKDFGAGYAYAVIIEDAKLSK